MAKVHLLKPYVIITSKGAVVSKFNLVQPLAYDGRNGDQMAAQAATEGGCGRDVPPTVWSLEGIAKYVLENAKK